MADEHAPPEPGGTPGWRSRSVDGAREFTVRLAALAGLALAGRIAYILVAKRPTDTCGKPRCGDAVYYLAQAWHLVDTGRFDDPAAPGMPAADHPPVTALLLTPAALIRRHTVLGGRLTMALVGVAVVVALGLLARRLAGDTAGLATAVVAAVNPNLWVNDALPMAEAPAAAAVAVVLSLVYAAVRRPSRRHLVLLGAACGLAVLTRAELGLLAPICVAPALLAAARAEHRRSGNSSVGRCLRTGAARAAGVGAVAALTVAPWTLWNLTRFDEPVLLSTNDGLTLVGANCDAVFHGGGKGFWNLDCARAVDPLVPPGADQSVRAAVQREAGIDYLRANIRDLPGVAAVRVGRLWGWHHPEQMVWLNQGEGRERWVSWAAQWTLWALLPLAGVGVARLHRERVMVWPLLSTAVVATLTAALFYGIVRFRVPFDVAETLLAGVGAAGLAAAARRRIADRGPVDADA